MPLYEYQCERCRRRLEVIQSFSAKPLRKCEECGGKLAKLISRSGFVLKGSGWYKSDYGAPAPASKSEKADDTAPASEGSKPEAPKPEAAKTPKAGGRKAKSLAGSAKD